SFFYRRNKFFWNITTFDFIYKSKAWFVIICGTDSKYNICKFTSTSRLLFVNFSVVSRLCKSFFVFHLRLSLVYFYFELSSHTVNNNVEVKLTHTGNNGLSGSFVGFYLESWIFFS